MMCLWRVVLEDVCRRPRLSSRHMIQRTQII